MNGSEDGNSTKGDGHEVDCAADTSRTPAEATESSLSEQPELRPLDNVLPSASESPRPILKSGLAADVQNLGAAAAAFDSYQVRLSAVAQKLAESTLAHSAFQYRTVAAAQNVLNSPAAKAALQTYDLDLVKAGRALAVSPEAKLFAEWGGSGSARAAQLLGASSARALWEIDDSLRAALKANHASTMEMAREAQFAAFGASAGKLATELETFAKQFGLRNKNLLASLNGPLGEAARALQWTRGLERVGAQLASRFPAPQFSTEMQRIQQMAASVLGASASSDRSRLAFSLGLRGVSAELEATRLKLSTLAGAGDVLGFSARTSVAAYDEIFGSWRTRPDLPQQFWERPCRKKPRLSASEC